MDRRSFLKTSAGGVALSSFLPVLPMAFAAGSSTDAANDRRGPAAATAAAVEVYLE